MARASSLWGLVLARTKTHRLEACVTKAPNHLTVKGSHAEINVSGEGGYGSKFGSGSGSLSPSLASQTYSVGKIKILIARLTINPPTITIAKGR